VGDEAGNMSPSSTVNPRTPFVKTQARVLETSFPHPEVTKKWCPAKFPVEPIKSL